jgi:hypothetical protein
VASNLKRRARPKTEKEKIKKVQQIKKKMSNLCLWTSSGVERAGIAPFLVVVITPHSFANLNISPIFVSL